MKFNELMDLFNSKRIRLMEIKKDLESLKQRVKENNLTVKDANTICITTEELEEKAVKQYRQILGDFRDFLFVSNQEMYNKNIEFVNNSNKFIKEGFKELDELDARLVEIKDLVEEIKNTKF